MTQQPTAMTHGKLETPFPCTACSAMALTSAEGHPYWFRTCDFSDSIWEEGAHVVSFPADWDLPLTGGRDTLHTRHAVLGVSHNKLDSWLLDGVNSVGLTGGLLLLHEATSVPTAAPGYHGVMGMELVTILLAVCETVQDVIQAARKIQILDIPTGKTATAAAEMHFMFTDAGGKTVVMEAADATHPGILQIYGDKETIGLLTNSPPYPEQLSNLSWYLSQAPELRWGPDGKPITALNLDGTTIRADPAAPHLRQNGTFPASYAAYDRFVRGAVLKALNHNGRDFSDEQMLARGCGLMHPLFEPHSQGIYHYTGFDREGRPLGRSDSYTQYTVMYRLEQPTLYLQPFDSTAWTQVTLSACSSSRLERHPVCREGMAGVVNGHKLSRS